MKSEILRAGLIAGTLDITAATIQYMLNGGKNPLLILKFIASGVFGKDMAYSNSFMPFLGLLFHYLLAFAFTIFFFWIYPKIRLAHINWQILGVLYGLGVWVVMNRIVMPLSNTPKMPFNIQGAVIGAAILVVCIGLPIAYFAHKYFEKIK